MSQATNYSNLANTTISSETLRDAIERASKAADEVPVINPTILVPGGIFKPEYSVLCGYLEKWYPEEMKRLRKELGATECKK